MKHRPFWADLAGKLGPPILAGTIVGCTLAESVTPSHWVLLAIGLVFTVVGHRFEFHA